MSKQQEDLFFWLVFGVALGLAPFVLRFLLLDWAEGSGEDLAWTLLFEKGELLLVSAVLAARGIGDLIGTGKKRRGWKWIAGAGCAMLLLVASGLYPDASRGRVNRQKATRRSVSIFVCTVIAAGSSKHLSGR